jgi:hypothetical protein
VITFPDCRPISTSHRSPNPAFLGSVHVWPHLNLMLSQYLRQLMFHHSANPCPRHHYNAPFTSLRSPSISFSLCSPVEVNLYGSDKTASPPKQTSSSNQSLSLPDLTEPNTASTLSDPKDAQTVAIPVLIVEPKPVTTSAADPLPVYTPTTITVLAPAPISISVFPAVPTTEMTPYIKPDNFRS